MRILIPLPIAILTLMATFPVPLHARAEHQTVIALPRPGSNRTSLPVANSTKSFWFTDPGVHPAPNEGSDGPLTSDADICIIGSGITGVSTAYHLAKAFKDDQTLLRGSQKQIKAVILEARDFCEPHLPCIPCTIDRGVF